jgi:preprotein translocase subunit SecG
LITLVTVIHVAACVVLILVILLQAGKGGGMGAAFGGGSQTVFGGRGAQTFLGKVTSICAGIFMLTSLTLAYHASRSSSVVKAAPAPAGQPAPFQGLPAAPAPVPPAAPQQSVPPPAPQPAPAAPAPK